MKDHKDSDHSQKIQESFAGQTIQNSNIHESFTNPILKATLSTSPIPDNLTPELLSHPHSSGI